MFWPGWHRDALGGCDWSATLMLSSLADAVRSGTLSDLQREVLATALRNISAAKPGPARMKATKDHLLLGRRPGRVAPFQAERELLHLAQAVWDRAGDVSGRKLDDAAADVARDFGVGRPANLEPDLRRIKKAYIENRELFIEIRELGYRDDEDRAKEDQGKDR